jgi:DNA polymerase-1
MLVGRFPAALEDKNGKLMVGKLGVLINELLIEAGINLGDVFVTTALRCRPQEEDDVTTKRIDFCYPFLRDEAQRVQPQVIIAMGDVATQSLLGFGRSEDIRGRYFTQPELGRRVVVTHHPSDIEKRVSKSAAVREAIVTDFRMAKKMVEEGVEEPKKDYRLLTKIEDVQQVVELFEGPDRPDRCAFDWETTLAHVPEELREALGVSPWRARPLGVAFSWAERQGIYIPVSRRVGEIVADFWGDAQAAVMALIARLLASPIPKVGHHVKYDIEVSDTAGMVVNGVDFDTGQSAHLLDENETTELDALTLKYHDLGLYKREVERFAGKRGSKSYDLSKVPLEALAKYAMGDTDGTLRLYHEHKPRLIEEGLWEPLFTGIVMPMVHLYARMEKRGLKVDAEVLGVEIVKWRGQVKALKEKIQKYPEVGEGTNIDNPAQMSVVLFERLKIPFPDSLTHVERGSTARPVLDAISGRHPLVQDLIEYRQNQKLLSSWGENILNVLEPDGTMHTNFLIHGTVSGRVSSRKPINIMAVSKNSSVRRAFVARPGYKFIKVDYGQIELRGIAFCGRDPKLVDAFQLYQDLHADTAVDVFRKTKEEVDTDHKKQDGDPTKKGYRDRGKRMNFGMFNGITTRGLASKFGISEAEANVQYERFWARYSVTAEYRDRVIRFAKKNGYVAGLFGRCRRHPNINHPDFKVREAAERELFDAHIQGSYSGDLPNRGAIWAQRRLDAEGMEAYLVLNEHDGLMWEVKIEDVPRAGVIISEELTSPPVKGWDIPIVLDTTVADTWAKPTKTPLPGKVEEGRGGSDELDAIKRRQADVDAGRAEAPKESVTT